MSKNTGLITGIFIFALVLLMMSEILVRHGESEADRYNIYAGQRINCNLTSRGRDQAWARANRLRVHDIKHIVSSPLNRARQTAEIFASGLCVSKVIVDPRIAEYDMGENTGKKRTTLTIAELLAGQDAESPDAFLARVASSIVEHKKDDGNTLFVAHSGVARVLRAYEAGIPPVEFYEAATMKNTEIWELPEQLVQRLEDVAE